MIGETKTPGALFCNTIDSSEHIKTPLLNAPKRDLFLPPPVPPLISHLSPLHNTASAPLQLPQPPSTQGVDMEGMGSALLPPLPNSLADGELIALVPSAPPMEAVEQVDLMELGTETLWRVTLTSQNAEVAASATQDLLEVSGVQVLLLWWFIEQRYSSSQITSPHPSGAARISSLC